MNVRQSPGPAAFTARGIRAREVFAHRVIMIPKQYPDLLADLHARGFTIEELAAGSFRQLNLYATQLDGFPEDLFTDPTVNWHRQQVSRKGLVAAAGLYLPGDGTAVVDKLQSDLCQQLFRNAALHREWRSRVDNRFGAWYKLIWNAVLDFALETGIRTLWCPTARTVLPRARPDINPALFERIYDGVASRYVVRNTERSGGEWWELTIEENRDRIVPLEPAQDELAERPARVIAVYHDIEENLDTDISADECRAALVRMLEVERAAGAHTTYNVVGTMFEEKARLIASQSPHHALGFHSYDHRIMDLSQLRRVREVNLKVRGYRPPRSVLTPELTDYRLSHYNFEWLLNVTPRAGADWALENGLVKIPAHLDDYPLETGALAYADWKATLLRAAETQRFVAVGLHDCYARHWLDDYAALLAELQRRGELWTCDEVADRCFLEGEPALPNADAAARASVTRETWFRFVRAARRARPEP
jgi:hypothetical protein